MIDGSAHNHLGRLLFDALVTFKSQTALVETGRNEVSSVRRYVDVLREASSLANRLHEEGLEPGGRVALLATNQSAWLISAIAVFFRGMVLIPLDSRMTPNEQGQLISRCAPDLLIAEQGLLSAIPTQPTCRTWTIGGRTSEHPRWEDTPEVEESAWLPVVERKRDDLATLVFSSGTGGVPRCCQLTHGNYLSQWSDISRLYAMQPGEVWLSILPTNHAIDFMCGFIGPLACGAVVVHPKSLRPEYLSWALQNCGVTHMAVVPMLLEALRKRVEERISERPPWQRSLLESLTRANERATRRGPRYQLSRTLLAPIHRALGGRLRLIFCGGAFTDPDLAEYFHRLGIPVVIGYGLTEACTVVTVNDLSPFRADTVGRPLPSVEVRIATPDEHGVGEVLVSGPTVMRGYTDAELNAETFTDDGWLKTGDRGRTDASGHLQLVGRTKNMIVTAGGKNLYPEDIEQHLGAVHCDEIAVFAATFLLGRDALGGDEERLLALVVTDDPVATSTSLALANQRLPVGKRVHGWCAWPNAFPKTATMKLKRNELAEQFRKNPCAPLALA